MNRSGLIIHNLPTLSLDDSGKKALHLMNEYRVFHLPLVQKDNYIALISEDDLLDWDTPEEPLSLAEFITFRPAVSVNAHAFEALKIFKDFNLSILPVLDEQKHFVGAITNDSLINYLTDNNAVNEKGAIIILEMEPHNYSMSEIARLCESNEINILYSVVKTLAENGMLQLTIKINKTDVQALVATFERYNYTIVEVFAAESYHEDLKQNYDSLMQYLDI